MKRDPAAPALVRELAFVVASLGDQPSMRKLLGGPAMKSLAGSEFEWLRLSLVAGLGDGCRRSKMQLAIVLQGLSGGRGAVAGDRDRGGPSRARPEATDQQRELALAVVALPLGESPDRRSKPCSIPGNRRRSRWRRSARRPAWGRRKRPTVVGRLVGIFAGDPRRSRRWLSTRDEYLNALFDAIERGLVPASLRRPARGALLVKHADAKIRARAEKLLVPTRPAGARKIVAQFLPALEISGRCRAGTSGLEARLRGLPPVRRYRQ